MLYKIECEVNVPDGWEPAERTMQRIFPPEGCLSVSDGDTADLTTKVRLPLRKVYRWPEHVTADYMAKDSTGVYYLFWECVETPVIVGDTWETEEGTRRRKRLEPDVLEIIGIPEIPGDWRQSLRKNPNGLSKGC